MKMKFIMYYNKKRVQFVCVCVAGKHMGTLFHSIDQEQLKRPNLYSLSWNPE